MANRIAKIIPNTLTCCNLIAGCTATVYAILCDPKMALACIIIGAAFDFFDGMTARLLHVSSSIGKELDSLADDITFGLAPAAIVWNTLVVMDYPSFIEPLRGVLPFISFVMAAFSALRLAKFNLDERQTTSFIGMPTPANALFWGSLMAAHSDWMMSSPHMVWVVIGLIALCSWLMVCGLPMFALKFETWHFRGNEIKYGFIFLSVLAVTVFGFTGCFSIIIPCYLLISVIVEIKRRLCKDTAGN